MITDLQQGTPLRRIDIPDDISNDRTGMTTFNGASNIALSSLGLIAVIVKSSIQIYSINGFQLWKDSHRPKIVEENSDEYFACVQFNKMGDKLVTGSDKAIKIIDLFAKDSRTVEGKRKVTSKPNGKRATILNIIIPNDDQIVVCRFDGQVQKYTTQSSQDRIQDILSKAGFR